MARTYLVFGDIEGKLDVLRIECTRCADRGGGSPLHGMTPIGGLHGDPNWSARIYRHAWRYSSCVAARGERAAAREDGGGF
jgi:hypothetical protein